MAKVSLGNIQLAYEVNGEGDPLLLIGGFTMVKEAWAYQVEGLSRKFRVITFDNRGVGDSTVPQEPFTISDMASDAIGLLDAIGVASANIFGISMGGLIAQAMALDHPGRVRKLALGCTTHGGREAVAPSPEVMQLMAKAADPSLPPEQSVRMRLPILFGERFLKEEPLRIQEWVSGAVRHAPTPQGAALQLKALSRFNVRERLGEIRCPVMVLTGSSDQMMDPENSRLLAQRIPGAKLHVLDGAGHLFFLEQPEEVNRVLQEFFQGPG